MNNLDSDCFASVSGVFQTMSSTTLKIYYDKLSTFVTCNFEVDFRQSFHKLVNLQTLHLHDEPMGSKQNRPFWRYQIIPTKNHLFHLQEELNGKLVILYKKIRWLTSTIFWTSDHKSVWYCTYSSENRTFKIWDFGCM